MDALNPIRISSFTLMAVRKAAPSFGSSNRAPLCANTRTSGKHKGAELTLFMARFPPGRQLAGRANTGIGFLIYNVGCVASEGGRLQIRCLHLTTRPPQSEHRDHRPAEGRTRGC